MIFHIGENLPMFIFACTSWMIPESIETNKKHFSKKKEKKSLLDWKPKRTIYEKKDEIKERKEKKKCLVLKSLSFITKLILWK